MDILGFSKPQSLGRAHSDGRPLLHTRGPSAQGQGGRSELRATFDQGDGPRITTGGRAPWEREREDEDPSNPNSHAFTGSLFEKIPMHEDSARSREGPLTRAL